MGFSLFRTLCDNILLAPVSRSVNAEERIADGLSHQKDFYCPWKSRNRHYMDYSSVVRALKRNPGSSDKSRGKPSLPDLSLHIVDMKGEERETVSLGELLRVQVRMSDEDTYGIFVRNLVAKDGSGGNNLTLIDNTG
ncbi:uncharacterized protein CEXT_170001 [Caerostris extrusa]|uniref:Uncharacterized protein n=1 Tax=Caerostris extrusa TaxID=172846 RepID=A0AAV4WL44_CAEEX|nr:uncharacterized protein CEXT_170001 [Caerostris extrusa]